MLLGIAGPDAVEEYVHERIVRSRFGVDTEHLHFFDLESGNALGRLE